MKKSTRREFLSTAALAAVAGVSGCRVFTGGAADFDENLSVFLADPHVCANPEMKRWLYTQGEFDRRVAEILAMDPLPRNVVVFGDLCFNNGDVRDYRLARRQIDLLTAAGVRVTLGTGNHDRRNTFLEVFPEAAKGSPVPGRIVSCVSLGHCDLVLLDSLKAADGAERGPTEGELNDAQQEWLAADLPTRTRPTVVAAHHPARELRVKGRKMGSVLQDAPKAVGWINGHEHFWMKEPLGGYFWEASNQDTLRGLYLPSAGLWGDIGYVEFRTGPTAAVAKLVQVDYWFHDHLHEGEEKPETWKTIIAENDGDVCRFPYARAYRKA